MNDSDSITKVWMLLDIIHKASTAGPAYAKWAQMAQEELNSTHDFLSKEEPAEKPWASAGPSFPKKEPVNG